jgi:hypothetical protein
MSIHRGLSLSETALVFFIWAVGAYTGAGVVFMAILWYQP